MSGWTNKWDLDWKERYWIDPLDALNDVVRNWDHIQRGLEEKSKEIKRMSKAQESSWLRTKSTNCHKEEL